MVLVDTPIWSVAFRRKALLPSDETLREQLAQLARRGEAQLLGVVRQELLSGVREHAQFVRLRQLLRDFPDVTLHVDDYESAAEMSNRLRSAGVTGSPVDVLLCSVALARKWTIFSTDHDFLRYAAVLPIQLLSTKI